MIKPILLQSWSDPYTLGIFCAKTNLVEYALKNRSQLRKDAHISALFQKGIAVANEWTFDDIGYEMAEMRNGKPDDFDNFIRVNSGVRVFRKVIEAIHKAQDWEDRSVLERAKEIMDKMFCARGNQRERNAEVDGEYLFMGVHE